MQETEQPKIAIKAMPIKVTKSDCSNASVETSIGNKPFVFDVEYRSYYDKGQGRVAVSCSTSGYEALSGIVDIDLKAVKLVGLKAIRISRRHAKQKREMDSIIALNKQIAIRKTAIGIFKQKCQDKGFLQDYVIKDGIVMLANGKTRVYFCSAMRGKFEKTFDLHIRGGNVLVEIIGERCRRHYKASVNTAVNIIYSEYSSLMKEIRQKAARTTNTEKFLNGLNDTGYIAKKAPHAENEIRIYKDDKQHEYSPSMTINVNYSELTANVTLALSPQQIIQVLEILGIPKANHSITAVA